MTRLDDSTYQVATNENVTLTITPIQVNPNFIAASLDGVALVSPVGPSPTYKFPVTKTPPLTHFIKLEASFPGAPDGARFDVNVSGSNGGSFTFSIKKSDGVHDPNVRFRVV